jgi:P-type Cu2+ transporter
VSSPRPARRHLLIPAYTSHHRADLDAESRPVSRGVGDRVVAGTVATDSAIRVEITAVGEDTALAGIGRLVAQAQASGGRAQVLADRFAAMLFYIATAAALVTFLVWWALGDVDQSVVRTVTVLVIACPHALGLAIPLVVLVVVDDFAADLLSAKPVR